MIGALRRAAGDWRAWIAGAPQKPGEDVYERELRRMCADLGIESRVQFLGERRDVAALMRAADVHCQPNNAPEPFGLAFVEALSASMPVITTDMGGAKEIVTPQCGVLVPYGDAGALRQALERAIKDAGYRRALGDRGPARASALCDPARQLARLAAVVEMVAA